MNNVLRYKLAEHGMQLVGVNPGRDLVEIVELPGKRWFVGVQFHPEYRSTALDPHPLFASFIEAAVKQSRARSSQWPPNTRPGASPTPASAQRASARSFSAVRSRYSSLRCRWQNSSVSATI